MAFLELRGLTKHFQGQRAVDGLSLSLERGEPGWALATAAAHLVGSLALTALGLWTVRAAIS